MKNKKERRLILITFLVNSGELLQIKLLEEKSGKSRSEIMRHLVKEEVRRLKV